MGNVTSWTYDAEGNVLTVTRPDSTLAMKRRSLSASGGIPHMTLTNTVDALNQRTRFAYDASGNLLSLTDAKGNAYSWTYDLRDRKLTFVYPGGSYEGYTYDDDGRMTQYRARNGSTMTCTFDLRNRDLGCNWSDSTPDATKTYDNAGRLLTLDNGSATLTYAYNAANELVSETTAISGQPDRTVSYAYDADGRRSTLTYPGGQGVGYTYTQRGQVDTISAGGPPPVVDYTYDLLGNRTAKALENGVTTAYGYDIASRLTNLAATGGGIALRVAYTLNTVGNRTARTEAWNGTDTTDAYGYDATYQLTNATRTAGGTFQQGFAYDAVGNRTTFGDNGTNTSYTANTLNQYTAVGGLIPTYDVNGNLASLGLNTSYAYDSQNRLVQAILSGTNRMDCTYDGRNRVVKREFYSRDTTSDPWSLASAQWFTYDGWSLIEERDGSGALVQEYVHGAQIDEILCAIRSSNPTPVYHLHDGLGTVVALADATGNLIERYSYDPFGRVSIRDAAGLSLSASSVNNRFLFTGREWQGEVGLYDYRNRVYSAELGRFLQTDPIRFRANDVNLFRLSWNSVASLRDPFGLCTPGEHKDCQAVDARVGLSNPFEGSRNTTKAQGTLLGLDLLGFIMDALGLSSIAKNAGDKAIHAADTVGGIGAGISGGAAGGNLTTTDAAGAIGDYLSKINAMGLADIWVKVKCKTCCKADRWKDDVVEVQVRLEGDSGGFAYPVLASSITSEEIELAKSDAVRYVCPQK